MNFEGSLIEPKNYLDGTLLAGLYSFSHESLVVIFGYGMSYSKLVLLFGISFPITSTACVTKGWISEVTTASTPVTPCGLTGSFKFPSRSLLFCRLTYEHFIFERELVLQSLQLEIGDCAFCGLLLCGPRGKDGCGTTDMFIVK